MDPHKGKGTPIDGAVQLRAELVSIEYLITFTITLPISARLECTEYSAYVFSYYILPGLGHATELESVHVTRTL